MIQKKFIPKWISRGSAMVVRFLSRKMGLRCKISRLGNGDERLGQSEALRAKYAIHMWLDRLPESIY